MILNSPYISGSLTVTGNITSQGGITISGSITSASYATTSSFATTASYANTSTSASYALTASFATNFTASNILASNTITAQTLVVQTVTSSIVYSSGSNIFGNQLTDVQQMTGSLRVTGSITSTGAATFSSSVTVSGADASTAWQKFFTGGTYMGYIGSEGGWNSNPYTDFVIGATTGRQITFYTNSVTSSRMVIASNGNVSIGGTSTPTYKLEISGSSGIFSFNPNQASTMVIRGSVAGNFDINNEGASGVIRLYGTSIQLRTAAVDPALTIASSGAATFASSVTANSIVSSTTITSTGAIRSGGGTISSYYSTAANVNNGGNTTFTYQQTSGEYVVGFMYSIVGLYAPSGTNILGVGQGYAYFFSDGSTNGTSTSAQIATGWSVAASATNAGAYTITFTNNSGATMSEVNYRIIKVNRTGAG